MYENIQTFQSSKIDLSLIERLVLMQWQSSVWRLCHYYWWLEIKVQPIQSDSAKATTNIDYEKNAKAKYILHVMVHLWGNTSHSSGFIIVENAHQLTYHHKFTWKSQTNQNFKNSFYNLAFCFWRLITVFLVGSLILVLFQVINIVSFCHFIFCAVP